MLCQHFKTLSSQYFKIILGVRELVRGTAAESFIDDQAVDEDLLRGQLLTSTGCTKWSV